MATRVPAHMSATVTRIIFDGHVHIYPHYDWVAALRALFRNLGTEGLRLGLLTETATCHFYQQAIDTPGVFDRDGLTLTAGPGPKALTVMEGGTPLGVLIAGRQIITAERLEVLAVGADAAIPDGQPIRLAIDSIRAHGGVPIVTWSPGKWFFGRGRQVADLLTSLSAGSFLLGDSALRPTCWPEPRLMQQGRQRGFKIIAGSDPLPLAREESRLGTYGVTAMAPFDALAPADSVYRLLTYGNTIFTPVGRRTAPLAFARRWIANQRR